MAAPHLVMMQCTVPGQSAQCTAATTLAASTRRCSPTVAARKQEKEGAVGLLWALGARKMAHSSSSSITPWFSWPHNTKGSSATKTPKWARDPMVLGTRLTSLLFSLLSSAHTQRCLGHGQAWGHARTHAQPWSRLGTSVLPHIHTQFQAGPACNSSSAELQFCCHTRTHTNKPAKECCGCNADGLLGYTHIHAHHTPHQCV